MGSYTQTEYLLDHKICNSNENSRPQTHSQHCKALEPKELCAAAVEKACKLNTVAICKSKAWNSRICQKAYCKSTPDAVHHVYCHSAHRVIYMEHIVKEPDAEGHQQTADSTYDSSACAVNHVTAGGNAHKPCQGGIEAHRNVGLAVLYPGEYHAYNRCHCGCHGSCKEYGSQLCPACSSRTVEAVPAEPQYEAPQSAYGKGMTGNSLYLGHLAVCIRVKLADAGA